METESILGSWDAVRDYLRNIKLSFRAIVKKPA
jgi:hypothetical protein